MEDTEAFIAYREHQRMRGLSSATISNASNELNRLRQYVAPETVLDVSHLRLIEWAQSLAGRCGPGSRYVKISRVHSFYAWAYSEELIDKIPTTRIPRPKVPQGVPRPMPVVQIVKALACAEPEGRLWIMLGAFGGLRCCEIARLSRDQIVDTAEPPHLRVRGKGNKERVVYLCADLLAELRSYPLPSRGYVFKRRDGKPGPPSGPTVSLYGNRVLHDAGVRETMHQLRHRFGTDLYAVSDLLTTADQLGHANVQTSRGYAKLNNAIAAKAVQSLGLPDGVPKAS